MSKIIFVIDDSMSYENLNKNRLGFSKFLKERGMPVIMSYCEHPNQIDVCQNDIDVSQSDTSNVSGGPIESTTPDLTSQNIP